MSRQNSRAKIDVSVDGRWSAMLEDVAIEIDATRRHLYDLEDSISLIQEFIATGKPFPANDGGPVGESSKD